LSGAPWYLKLVFVLAVFSLLSTILSLFSVNPTKRVVDVIVSVINRLRVQEGPCGAAISPGVLETVGLPRILITVGTRPEAIKMAPVIKAMRATATQRKVQVIVVAVGQHTTLLKTALESFEVTADVEVKVLSEDQTLAGLASRVLAQMECLYGNLRPKLVLVQVTIVCVTYCTIEMCALCRAIPPQQH
jgi:hypothetical protein